jgi:hypothetical protein
MELNKKALPNTERRYIHMQGSLTTIWRFSLYERVSTSLVHMYVCEKRYKLNSLCAKTTNNVITFPITILFF